MSANEGLRPTVYEALGTMRVLDAHAGGLLARELALRYTMNPAASARKVSHIYMYACPYTHAYTYAFSASAHIHIRIYIPLRGVNIYAYTYTIALLASDF